MPIVLYGYPSSPPCRAVLLTAKAIGVDIEMKELDMYKGENKSEDFLKMNPTHTIPTLDDNGFYMWESRAIMAYLVQQYGKNDKLYPSKAKDRALVDNMLYFDADCLFPSLVQYLKNESAEDEPALKAIVMERIGFLNTILQSRKYATGDHLTIADLSLISSFSAIEAAAIDLTNFPNVKKWAAKVKSKLPFYDKVTKKGIEQLTAMLAAMKKK